MKLFAYVADREWTPVFGYGLFAAVLAAGYYYNLTFVQLGLLDLGTERVGLRRFAVSVAMGALALTAVAVAVAAGVTLDRRGWSSDLLVKLRILLAVVAVQTALTVAAPFVAAPAAFYAWVAVCAVSLGVGMPVTFSLAVDLVPVRDRGYVAAAVTAAAFGVAAVYPMEWRVVEFSAVMTAAMVPAVVVLGWLALRPPGFVHDLAGQHREFGVGRFCRPDPVSTRSAGFWLLVLLMFGVFFVDSLGFLRIVETPVYVAASWQSPDIGVRLFIAGTHVVGAAMAGVLYTNFGRRSLFAWVLGLFAFTHLLYTFDVRTTPNPRAGLLMPMFYATAVSFYTTLNFALWPDLSTPETVGTHTAVGVGLAGFGATFLSTAGALYLRATGATLLEHLNAVNALALLLFVALVVGVYLRRVAAHARAGGDAS